ncbi:MAG: DUF2846 domain-containing protein [Burkholderiales bacterium]
MSNFTRNVRFIALVAALSLLGACASVPMASPEEDMQAKQFEASPDQSRIYVYRNENFGGAIRISITLDGRMMGQTAAKTYFMWNVTPGPHTISCVGENTASLNIDARPGSSHFVWQEMKMGLWSARCALHDVDSEKGREAVLSTKLIQSAN